MEINNTIHESDCSFELSKLLKQKGYRIPSDFYYTAVGGNGITNAGHKTWEDLKNGKGSDIIRPTHSLAMKWFRLNFNWHFELIWDIENGEKVWFYELSQIGDLKNEAINTPKQKTIEQANEDALFKALGQEPVDPNSIKGIDYDNIKDLVLKEYSKGNIVVATFEGIQAMPLKEFMKQPVEGMLYDLNRNEVTILTFIKDQKWINDYAFCKAFQELKRELDELRLAHLTPEDIKKDLKFQMLEQIFVKTGGRQENPIIAEICADIATNFITKK